MTNIFNNSSAPNKNLFNNQNQNNNRSSSANLFNNSNANIPKTQNSMPSNNPSPNASNPLILPGANHSSSNSIDLEAPRYSFSFQDVAKKLKNKEGPLKTQQIIFLGQGCQFFQKSEKQKNVFNAMKDKPHLNFGKQEKVHLVELPTCKQIDQIWIKLIRHFTAVTEAHQMIGYTILRRILRKTQIYEKLYIPVSGMNNKVFKPNVQFIKLFYINTTKESKVYTEYITYQEFLINMVTEFFKQYHAYIDCIQFLMRRQNFKRQQSLLLSQSSSGSKQSTPKLAKVFKQIMDQNLIGNLWNYYKILSCSQQSKKTTQSKNNQENSNSQIRESILKFRRVILGQIGKVLAYILKHYFKPTDIYKKSPLKIVQVIKFINEDISYSQGYGLIPAEFQEQYLENALHIILNLIPFLMFIKQETFLQEIQKKKIKSLSTAEEQEILMALHDIDNKYFRGLKIIASNLLVRDGKLSNSQGFSLKRIQSIISKNQWNMNQSCWNQWLGAFLDYFTSDQIFESHSVKNIIIPMCKQVVYNEADQFWQIVGEESQINLNLFYLQKIQRFGMDIRQSQEEPFEALRIFTKAIRPHQFLQDTNKKIISFFKEQFREIIQSISQPLKLQGSTFKTELSYQTSNSQVQVDQSGYEHALKFFCKMVKYNKDNLDILQQQFFDVKPNLKTQENSGYLLITFLCRCIKKLHYIGRDIKCLRYIFQTLDFFFCNRSTRRIFLFIISVFFPVKINSLKNDTKELKIIDLVNICNFQNSPDSSQYENDRQIQKLRCVLSRHLYNLVNLSDSIQSNFPIQSNHQLQSKYELYEKDLNDMRFQNVIDCIYNQQHMRPSEWFYSLLGLLTKNSLNSLNLATVTKLLQKLRVSQECPELHALQQVVNTLRKSYLSDCIFEELRPQYDPKQAQYLGYQFLKLGNSNIMNVQLLQKDSINGLKKIKSNEMLIDFSLKYRNPQYAKYKNRQSLRKKMLENASKINASIQIVQEVLKIMFESKQLLAKLSQKEFYEQNYMLSQRQACAYPLINQIQEIRIIFQRVTNKQSLWIYQLSDYIKGQSTGKRSINIITTLISCLVLQKRIKFKTKYTHQQNLKVKLQLNPRPERIYQKYIQETKSIQVNYFNNIFYSDHCPHYLYQSQGSTKGCVMRILEILIKLGFFALINKSLLNNGYPKESLYQLSLNGSTNQKSYKLKLFVRQLINNLRNTHQNRLIRCQSMQLLSVLVESTQFLNIVLDYREKIRQVITQHISQKNINIDFLNKICLLFKGLCKHLHIETMSKMQVRQNVILRFFKYPDNLINRIFDKLLKLGKQHSIDNIQLTQTSNQLFNVLYKKRINRYTIYRSTLTLLIELFHKQFEVLDQTDISTFVSMLCQQSEVLLERPLNLSKHSLTHKLELHPQNILTSFYQHEHFYTIFSSQDENFSNCLSVQPFRFGSNYFYNPLQAYNRLKVFSNEYIDQEALNSQVCFIQVLNCLKGLQHTYHLLHKKYFQTLLMVLHIGSKGQNLSNFILDNSIPKLYQQKLLYGKYQTKNQVSSRSSLNGLGFQSTEKTSKLIKLSQYICEHMRQSSNSFKIFTKEDFQNRDPILLKLTESIEFQSYREVSKNQKFFSLSIDLSLFLMLKVMDAIMVQFNMADEIEITSSFIQKISKALQVSSYTILSQHRCKGSLQYVLLNIQNLILSKYQIYLTQRKYLQSLQQSNPRNSVRQNRNSRNSFVLEFTNQKYLLVKFHKESLLMLQKILKISIDAKKELSLYKYSKRQLFKNIQLICNICDSIYTQMDDDKLYQNLNEMNDRLQHVSDQFRQNQDLSKIKKQIQYIINFLIVLMMDNFEDIPSQISRILLLNLCVKHYQINDHLPINKWHFYDKHITICQDILFNKRGKNDIKQTKMLRSTIISNISEINLLNQAYFSKQLVQYLFQLILVDQKHIKNQKTVKYLHTKPNTDQYNQSSLFHRFNLREIKQQSKDTLEQIIQYKLLFSSILLAVDNEGNWDNIGSQAQINAIFIEILNCHLLSFDPTTVNPILSVEKQLSALLVWEHQQTLIDELDSKRISDRLNPHQSVFQFICFKEQNQLALNYFYIIQEGFRKSMAVQQVSNIKFSIEEFFDIWNNFSVIFSKANDFYLNYSLLYLQNDNLVKNLTKIHNYVSNESTYLNDFQCLNSLFEEHGMKQFKFLILDSIIVYVTTLLIVVDRWRQIELKSRKAWRQERVFLLHNAVNLLSKNFLYIISQQFQTEEVFQLKAQLKESIKREKGYQDSFKNEYTGWR